jgi:hypothetical protein
MGACLWAHLLGFCYFFFYTLPSRYVQFSWICSDPILNLASTYIYSLVNYVWIKILTYYQEIQKETEDEIGECGILLLITKQLVLPRSNITYKLDEYNFI